MTNKDVDTRKVTGRRTVRYESYADLLADAERITVTRSRTLGNWSIGQIFRHCAMSIDTMIDGSPFALPKPLQWLLRIFMKRRMTTRTLDPGFKLPRRAARMIPDATSVEEGLALLKRAIARIESTSTRIPHPGFGVITNQEWDAFQLRHCEMHMSFIVRDHDRSSN